jgi:hypothetical protein
MKYAGWLKPEFGGGGGGVELADVVGEVDGVDGEVDGVLDELGVVGPLLDEPPPVGPSRLTSSA